MPKLFTLFTLIMTTGMLVAADVDEFLKKRKSSYMSKIEKADELVSDAKKKRERIVIEATKDYIKDLEKVRDYWTKKVKLKEAMEFQNQIDELKKLVDAGVSKNLNSTSKAYGSLSNARNQKDITGELVGGERTAAGIVLRTQRLESKEAHSVPIEIEYTCMTDSTNIRIAYACKELIFNWEGNQDELRIGGGPAHFQHKPGAGRVPTHKFITIKQVVEKDKMTIYVDGKERGVWVGDFSLINSPIAVFSYQSTVTVKSIKVRKL